jgi:hypothetical protein
MSTTNINEAAHVIAAVCDLEEWSILDRLRRDLKNWLLHKERNLRYDGKEESELLEVVSRYGDRLLHLPNDQDAMEQLSSVMQKRYVDRTFIQKDYSASYSAFPKDKFFGLSGNPGSLEQQAAVEIQQTIAAYLSERPLDTPAWTDADVCVAVVTGHGQLCEGKLHLCYETKSESKTSVEKGFWPIAGYWCAWWACISKNEFRNKRLVLVLDICHSGAAIAELRGWCNTHRDALIGSNCTVQMYTSCSNNELARGEYYLHTWLQVHQMRRTHCEHYQPETDTVGTLLEQNPQYYSSDPYLPGYPEVLTGADLFLNWQNLGFTDNIIERFYRAASAATEFALLESKDYAIVDVKMFVSGKPDEPDGYQIAAIVRARNGQEWSQHVHLCSATLESQRLWKVKVSPTMNSSAKNIVSIPAQPDHTVVTVDDRAGKYSMTNYPAIPAVKKHQDDAVAQYEVPTDEVGNLDPSAMIFMATTSGRYEERDRVGTLQAPPTPPAKKGKVSTALADVHAYFVEKVLAFLRDNGERSLYLCDEGRVASVAEWLTLCGPPSAKPASDMTAGAAELRKRWNCGASVLTLFRTRVTHA